MPDLTAYNWRELSPVTSPSARRGHRMVWDGNRIILFGGVTATAMQSDTWEFDGTDWNNLSPATTPDARIDHSMVWDGTRVLMFGGFTISSPFYSDETWEFVGGDWNLLSPSSAPAARGGAAMVWDGTRLILYGGYALSLGMQKDTWEFDGADWTELFPANYVPDIRHPTIVNDGRVLMGMVWDGTRAVLFSGCSDPGGSFELPSTHPFYETGGGTWVYETGDWSQPSPATSPRARFGVPMAITDDDQKILMFGGDVSYVGGGGRSFVGDTLQFDGSDWEDLAKLGPSSRGGGDMVWDTVDNRFLMFGGRSGNGTTLLGDTWEFATDAPDVDYVSISHTFGLGQ